MESGTSGPPTAPGHPPKPKVVTGCVLEYQYVEVTHSAIQLAFGVAGLVIAAFVAHFYITGRTTNYNSFFCLHRVKKITDLPRGQVNDFRA